MSLKQKKAPQRRLVFLSDDTLERINVLSNDRPDVVLFDANKKLLGEQITTFFKARGIKVTSHDFRKTRATNFHKEDHWSILQIAAYLGHADIKTTQAYVEVDPELGYEYLVE